MARRRTASRSKTTRKETEEVTTLWSFHALRSTGDDGDFSKAAEERAMVTVESSSTSIEHLALRYVVSIDMNRGKKAATLRTQIISHQNGDGGWGWLLKDASDAMATGQALYALSFTGGARSDVILRAQQFLVQTQQVDGSWHVPATLKEQDGKPYAVSNDWGTAWALIGLLRTADR